MYIVPYKLNCYLWLWLPITASWETVKREVEREYLFRSSKGKHTQAVAHTYNGWGKKKRICQYWFSGGDGEKNLREQDITFSVIMFWFFSITESHISFRSSMKLSQLVPRSPLTAFFTLCKSGEHQKIWRGPAISTSTLVYDNERKTVKYCSVRYHSHHTKSLKGNSWSCRRMDE